MKISSGLVFLLVLFLNLTAGCTAAHLARQDTLSERQDRFFQGSLIVWATSATALASLLTRSPVKKDGHD